MNFDIRKIIDISALTTEDKTLMPPPWEKRHDPLEVRKDPPYNPRLRLLALISAPLLLLIGFLAGNKVMAGLGAGILALLWTCFQRLWRQTRHIEIVQTQVPPIVYEKEDAEFKITLKNTGPKPTESIIVGLTFLGSFPNTKYFEIQSLRRMESRTLVFHFPCNVGMGKFACGQLSLIFQDAFSLFQSCRSISIEDMITVLPKRTPMGELPIDANGSNSYTGIFEIEKTGDGINFLGTRAWRQGDSLRRVDWKRTAQYNELIVKEFESLTSPDATILLDDRLNAHCSFGNISSFESLRDACYAVANQLIEKQLNIQVLSGSFQLPSGSGNRYLQMLEQSLMESRLQENLSLIELVHNAVILTKKSDLLILFLSSEGLDFEKLWIDLLPLQIQGSQVIIFIADAKSFHRAVSANVNLNSWQLSILSQVHNWQGEKMHQKSLDSFLNKIAINTYILRADGQLADLFVSKQRTTAWGELGKNR